MFKIANNTTIFVHDSAGIVSLMQNGETCERAEGGEGYLWKVKRGVPTTIVSDVGETFTISIYYGSDNIAAVIVGTTLETAATFTFNCDGAKITV